MDTYSVRAYFRKSSLRKKDGMAQVCLLVGINSKQRKVSTGIYLLPKHWNEESREVRRTHPDYNDLNVEIRQRVADANDIFKYYRRRDMPLTIDIFIQEYSNPGSRKDFLEYLRIKIERRFEMAEIVSSTRIKHQVVYRKLKSFRETIPFQMITELFLDDFDLWHLRKLREDVGADKLINDGAGPRNNASKIIRTYLNLAHADGIEFDKPKIVTKIKHPEAPFLRKEELLRLVDLYSHSGRMPETRREVLRCFLGMCFSGMSYTDAQSLDWEQIRDGVLYYVRNKMKRYHRKVKIPVMPILAKYLGKPDKGLVYKSISEPYFNRELKWIGGHLDLKIKLTSKVARDTFGTIYAEETGGDIITLMQLMGHQKIETTAKYIHLSDGHMISQMEMVFGESSDFIP